MREYFVWLAKLLTILLIILVGLPILAAATTAVVAAVSDTEPGVSKSNTVAVVELKGIITDSKNVVDQLYRSASDKNVKGVVLRIDSPGGAVGPSQEIYSAVRKVKEKKPVVASMGGVAASGGLYAALGASKIFASPGTLTGSIGVIFQLPNFHVIAEKVGVDVVTVKSGKLKDVGNQFREMTADERAFLEETVTKVHQDFIAAVTESRGLTDAKVNEFADGRVIIGSDAKRLGLIDDFGGLHEAAREVFVLRKEPLKPDEEPKLVYTGDKLAEVRRILQGVLRLTESIAPASLNGELQFIMN